MTRVSCVNDVLEITVGEQAMTLLITILLVAIPVLALIGMVVFDLYCMFTDKQHREKYGRNHDHPDRDMPLYDVGHCDDYSAGIFTW